MNDLSFFTISYTIDGTMTSLHLQTVKFIVYKIQFFNGHRVSCLSLIYKRTQGN